jgi:hypothetical protein
MPGFRYTDGTFSPSSRHQSFWEELVTPLHSLTENKKFWEELVAYFPDTARTAQKTTPPTILHCRGNVAVALQ